MTAVYENYIDGQWAASESGETTESTNPATGDVVAEVPDSTREDTRRAIDAAERAFEETDWADRHGKERGAAMREIAAKLEANLDPLAELATKENGKPLATLKNEIETAIDKLDYFAGQARDINGRTIESASGDPDYFNVTTKEPVGVVGVIVPWNDPIDLLVRKLAPALAAGCTVVVKPASATAACTMEFVDLIDDVDAIPDGVVNCVTGPGSVVGDELSANQQVRKVSFTGSSTVGSQIMETASDSLKELSLECGGKAPNIVFEDADYEKALNATLYASFMLAGQSCTACTRLIVEESIHEQFVEDLVARLDDVEPGDPMEDTIIGPVTTKAQLDKVLSYIEQAKDEYDLVAGGERITEPPLDQGYFVEPTIFDDVDPDAPLACEEIFGPVLAVIPFETKEEAIEIANNTEYGLSGAVWTSDSTRLFEVAQELEVGDVWMNTYYRREPEMPFGGVKKSGVGKELGHEGLEEYLHTKRMCLGLDEGFNPNI
jgi:betaine-aldehyde dehydrogenase